MDSGAPQNLSEIVIKHKDLKIAVNKVPYLEIHIVKTTFTLNVPVVMSSIPGLLGVTKVPFRYSDVLMGPKKPVN